MALRGEVGYQENLFKKRKARGLHELSWGYMSCVMSRTNRLLAAAMVVLGLAVLARAVAINQHAYSVLLQPPM